MVAVITNQWSAYVPHAETLYSTSVSEAFDKL